MSPRLLLPLLIPPSEPVPSQRLHLVHLPIQLPIEVLALDHGCALTGPELTDVAVERGADQEDRVPVVERSPHVPGAFRTSRISERTGSTYGWSGPSVSPGFTRNMVGKARSIIFRARK